MEELLRQMLSIAESHQQEYKIQIKTPIQSLHGAFKERAERLFRKVYTLEYLTHLSVKLKAFQTSDQFFAYLKEAQFEADTLSQRLVKGVEFFKANIEDNQDEESVFVRMGARAMHSILSGQFQCEDIDLLNQGT